MMTTSELDVFSCALDGTTLIEASAGTGKTWNICGLYLRMLLERELTVQQVLVVTFTNAATAELRDRIRSRIAETLAYLQQSGAPVNDPFVPGLVTAVETCCGRTREQMIRILDLALQSFDEAAIFTIHGFCQRALADTPFSSAMPFASELVQDDSPYLMEAVHDFWRRHIGGGALSPEFVAYLVEKNESPQRLARLLKRHLAKPKATYLWPEALDKAKEAATRLSQLYLAAKATWMAEASAISALLHASLPDLTASYNEDLVREAIDACDAFFSGDAPPTVPPTLHGVKLKAMRSRDLQDATRKKRQTPQHRFFDQVQVLLDELPALQAKEDEVLPGEYFTLVRRLFESAAPELRRRKRERRIVAFDDMLYNVYEALEGGNFPWLAGMLRARFPAALIDEFQDTDPLQFAIFNTIYGGSGLPLFFVGDPKQAIYSFRNADLHTYLQAKQTANAAYTLSGNQRSSEGLINALNALFSANQGLFRLPGLEYQHVSVGKKPRTPFLDKSEPRGDLHVWMLPSDDTSAIGRGAAKVASVDAVAAEIARLINDAGAGKIMLGDRALEPGDIAVLVRSHAQGSAIRAALASLNIGSVELSQASVFDSADAADLECVLCAILEPGRTGLLLAALATPLIGYDAAAIVSVTADEKQLMTHVDRFARYRNMWFKRGVGFMYRQLLAEENVSSRMLCQPDGERHLTNLLHLGEHLHQAAAQNPSPEAMLRWLQTKRRDGMVDEAAQIRLESDEKLVQIVTIHKSKGLEYPVVFCPFLWDGHVSNQNALDGEEYHAEDGTGVIDFRTDAASITEAKRLVKLEQSAETLRLIYVALTRAAHRCYLIAGTYSKPTSGKPSVKEGTHTLLNWIVAGGGHTPRSWDVTKLTPADITKAWTALAKQASPHMTLSQLPSCAGTPVRIAHPSPEKLAAQAPPQPIPPGWRVGSFSWLTHGARSERSASDHDARAVAPVKKTPPADLAHDDILHFPRGATAGDCLHAVFETIDFGAPATWPVAISRALAAFPQPAAATEEQGRMRPAMISKMLADVLSTPLKDGMALQQITEEKRLAELEFHIPSQGITADQLNRWLKEAGYPAPALHFRDLEGYLRGFMDLVFEHDGRYYILDWKSNHLGYTPEDYGKEGMATAMANHGYHLQYLLYSVALQRYLAHRLAGAYDFDRHFGGIFYLFVRGVRPGWKLPDGSQAGVYYHRPGQDTLAALEKVIATNMAREAA
jgi:exodeoxyribonuclease V beta subunit